MSDTAETTMTELVEKVDDYMMLGRTIDKAHATLQGLLGEYMYDCPLDKRLFGFLGISAHQLLELVETQPVQ